MSPLSASNQASRAARAQLAAQAAIARAESSTSLSTYRMPGQWVDDFVPPKNQPSKRLSWAAQAAISRAQSSSSPGSSNSPRQSANELSTNKKDSKFQRRAIQTLDVASRAKCSTPATAICSPAAGDPARKLPPTKKRTKLQNRAAQAAVSRAESSTPPTTVSFSEKWPKSKVPKEEVEVLSALTLVEPEVKHEEKSESSNVDKSNEELSALTPAETEQELEKKPETENVGNSSVNFPALPRAKPLKSFGKKLLIPMKAPKLQSTRAQPVKEAANNEQQAASKQEGEDVEGANRQKFCSKKMQREREAKQIREAAQRQKELADKQAEMEWEATKQREAMQACISALIGGAVVEKVDADAAIEKWLERMHDFENVETEVEKPTSNTREPGGVELADVPFIERSGSPGGPLVPFEHIASRFNGEGIQEIQRRSVFELNVENIKSSSIVSRRKFCDDKDKQTRLCNAFFQNQKGEGIRLMNSKKWRYGWTQEHVNDLHQRLESIKGVRDEEESQGLDEDWAGNRERHSQTMALIHSSVVKDADKNVKVQVWHEMGKEFLPLYMGELRRILDLRQSTRMQTGAHGELSFVGPIPAVNGKRSLELERSKLNITELQVAQRQADLRRHGVLGTILANKETAWSLVQCKKQEDEERKFQELIIIDAEKGERAAEVKSMDTQAMPMDSEARRKEAEAKRQEIDAKRMQREEQTSIAGKSTVEEEEEVRES